MGLAHSLASALPVTFPLPLSRAGLARVRQAGALLPPVARAYVMPVSRCLCALIPRHLVRGVPRAWVPRA